MKIAIVLNTSWNIINFRKGLIKGLQNEGHEIVAIAPRDTFSEKIAELGCAFVPIKMDSRGINPFRDLALLFELLWKYKKISPDLILHYTVKPNIFGSIASGILGIPCMANVCGLGTLFLHPGLASFLAQILYRLAFIFPAKVFFQNKDDQDIFITKKLVDPEKCQQVPGSGVDTDYFRPGIKTENDEIRFLLMARIIKDKGIREFLKAGSLLRKRGYKIRLSILGQLDVKHKYGISNAEFREWLDWSQAEYLGFTNDVRPHISKCDVVVLPSYREGTPKSLLEAAASGKPVICSDVPGCNQVVKEGFNGFMCRAKDEQDLAKAMEKFCRLERNERRQMGRNSRSLAEMKFSENKVIAIYSETIRNVQRRFKETASNTTFQNV